MQCVNTCGEEEVHTCNVDGRSPVTMSRSPSSLKEADNTSVPTFSCGRQRWSGTTEFEPP